VHPPCNPSAKRCGLDPITPESLANNERTVKLILRLRARFRVKGIMAELQTLRFFLFRSLRRVVHTCCIGCNIAARSAARNARPAQYQERTRRLRAAAEIASVPCGHPVGLWGEARSFSTFRWIEGTITVVEGTTTGHGRALPVRRRAHRRGPSSDLDSCPLD
jgi:hypothetical protein